MCLSSETRLRARHCIPPIVGSLFSWKSLLTKRITSEDCDKVSFMLSNESPRATYLSDCCFAEQDQLDAAARFRLRGSVRHCDDVDVGARFAIGDGDS